MTRINQAYGLNNPLENVFPKPVVAQRAPSSGDKNYPIGQNWIYQSADQSYVLSRVTAGEAIWILEGISSESTFPITPYVVGPEGQAGYSTIQSAIDAAESSGGGIVYVQPGTYSEDLTVPLNVSLIATERSGGNVGLFGYSIATPTVELEGSITVDVSAGNTDQFTLLKGIYFNPSSGDVLTYITNFATFNNLYIEDCSLQVNGDGDFILVNNGFGTFNFNNCVLVDGAAITGYLFKGVPSEWFFVMNFRNSVIDINDVTPIPIGDNADIDIAVTDSTWNAMIDASVSATAFVLVTLQQSEIEWNGSSNEGLVNFGSNEGRIEVTNCRYFGGTGPFSISTSGAANSISFIDNTYFTDILNLNSTSNDRYFNCTFDVGAGAAIDMESSTPVLISNSTINSPNNPAITGTGAGTLTLTATSFLDNSSLAATLTVQGGTTTSGAFNTVDAGAGLTIYEDHIDAIGSDSNISISLVPKGVGTVFVDGRFSAGGVTSINDSTNANTTINAATSTGSIFIGNSNSAGLTINSGSAITVANSVSLTTSGTQLRVKGGAVTDFIGSATLVAGTVTVANTNIAATDKIIVTREGVAASTALGILDVSISAGASFTITSLQPGTPGSTETNDVSIVNYLIVRQL